MKTNKTLMKTGAAFVLSLFAASVMAAVSPQEAEKLGTTLTPVGAEKAGNAAGTIPEWTGGLAKDAGKQIERGFWENPYENEQPEFVITAQNYQEHKDNLTPGQVAMFERYPETFRMP